MAAVSEHIYEDRICFSEAEVPQGIKTIYEALFDDQIITANHLHRFLIGCQGDINATKKQSQTIIESFNRNIFEDKCSHLNAFSGDRPSHTNLPLRPTAVVKRFQTEAVKRRIACWSDLPWDLLHTISDKIVLQDLINFGRVCSTWRSFSTNLIQRLILVRPKRSSICFFSPLDGKYYKMKLPGLSRNSKNRRQIYGFSNGWLAIKHWSLNIELLHLLSGHSINLPPMPGMIMSTRIKVCMSSNFSVIVAVDKAKGKLFFLRSKKDLLWTPVTIDGNRQSYCFHDVIYYNQKFYAIATFDNSLVYVLHLEELDGTSSTPLITATRVSSMVLRSGFDRQCYLVESSGDLLVVDRTRLEKAGWEYEVRRLATSGFGSINLEAEIVTDLGEYTLFVGRCQSCSVSTSNVPCLEMNSIYCTEDQESGCDGEIFNLHDKTRKELSFF